MNRKRFLQNMLLLGALGIASTAGMAQAENWPQKPVTLVVPYPPGGPTDIVARVVAQGMAEQLGQTVVVDNRAGAGGNIGADLVARAQPDGHTLLVATTAHAINMSLFDNLNYHVRGSFAPISLLTQGPLMLVVHPSVKANNVQELIALAKSSPQELRYASSGNGQSTHLSAELFAAMAGIQMIHVPYRGSAPALADLIGGQVDLMFNTTLSSMGYVGKGQLRALAVTASQRSHVAPDVPTVAEQGLAGYEATAWNGLLAPKDTPAAVVQRLSDALEVVLQSSKVRETFAAQGFDADYMAPQAFGQYIDAEITKWAEVVQQSGAKVE